MANKVVLSGASGLVGGWIKQGLDARRYQVITAGRRDSEIHFDFEAADMFSAPEDFASKDVDAFIHCAAANEILSNSAPQTAVHYNVLGTRAALDFCVENRVKKFIYISTFHVYGAECGDITEATLPKPLNEYGINHLMAEEYVRMYDRKDMLQGFVVRPTNIYGMPPEGMPFDRWTLVPFAFCRDVVTKNCIELQTHGMQRRNFVAADHLCKIIIKLLNGDTEERCINACGVDNLTIKEFAQKVIERYQELTGLSASLTAPLIEVVESNLNVESKLGRAEGSYETIDSFVDKFIRRLIRKSYS